MKTNHNSQRATIGDAPAFSAEVGNAVQTAILAVVKPGESVLLACSGGRDSCALLHALYSMASKFDVTIIVAHVNHHLRAESDIDERFVRELCERYGLEFCSTQLTPPATPSESWARTERYRALEEMRTRYDCSFIATGHHADDQAETILFRTLAGRLDTGARGVRASDTGRKLVRPLHSVEGEALNAYVDFHGLEYVEDQTNLDTRYTRNRLRHELLPLLKSEWNPRIVEGLCRFAARSEQDEQFFESIVPDAMQALRHDLSAITELAPALGWRALRALAFESVGSVALEVSYRRWSALSEVLAERILTADKRRCVSFAVGRGIICALSERMELSFRALSEVGSFAEKTITWETGAELRWEALSQVFHFESVIEDVGAVSQITSITAEAHIELFDADELDTPLIVRSPTAGDTVQCIGKIRKKVGDLFKECQIPLSERGYWPLLCSDEGRRVIMIPGIRRSDAALLSSKTKKLLQITVRRSSV